MKKTYVGATQNCTSKQYSQHFILLCKNFWDVTAMTDESMTNEWKSTNFTPINDLDFKNYLNLFLFTDQDGLHRAHWWSFFNSIQKVFKYSFLSAFCLSNIFGQATQCNALCAGDDWVFRCWSTQICLFLGWIIKNNSETSTFLFTHTKYEAVHCSCRQQICKLIGV